MVFCLVILVGLAWTIFHFQHQALVQDLLQKVNQDFKGCISIERTEISFVEDFPLIDIDLKGLRIYETKDLSKGPIAHFDDLYVGFNLWTIINGSMEIKQIHIEKGHCDIIQYNEKEFNILNAFLPTAPIESVEEEFHLDLKSIVLKDVHLSKENRLNGVKIDLSLNEVESSIRTDSMASRLNLDASFQLSLIIKGDTTFLRNKHLAVKTEVNFDKLKNLLSISPTTVSLEKANFDLSGTIDFNRDVFLDLKIGGDKPNFDLFLALAPNELDTVLSKYSNRGKIFFETTIWGSCINGNVPAINAKFGCQSGFVENTEVHKQLNDLSFSGYFTNGSKHSLETMEFGLRDFSMRPDVGVFSGDLVVKNFNEPDIKLKLNSDFNLNFITKFFGLKDFYDLEGKVLLTMNFHDIIDLSNPEKSIESLNESYYTELKVQNLKFINSRYPLPIHDFDFDLKIDGHYGHIDLCDLKIGNSDLHLTGSVSDLPAIIHHTSEPVIARLDIQSKHIDLFELTGSDSLSVDEQLKDLSVKMHFNASAKSFTESKYLPKGEFFVDDLNVQFKHYAHQLQDFHADVYVTDTDFRVIDFTGLIDESDFHFSGNLKHYDLWFEERSFGNTHLEFDLKSKMLQLNNILGYKGKSFLPPDYQMEEIDNLEIKGNADLVFDDTLSHFKLSLKNTKGVLKSHDMSLKQLAFQMVWNKDLISVSNGILNIGNSDLHLDFVHKFNPLGSGRSSVSVFSDKLDFDQLFAWQERFTSADTVVAVSSTQYHDEGYSIYQLPFGDMDIKFDVGDLKYHKYHLGNIKGDITTHSNRIIDIHPLIFTAADGDFYLEGVLNAMNPKHIFLDGKMDVDHVDLDKLFFKLDNFGQDYLVSENLHGSASTKIRFHVPVHKDFAPILEDAEVHLDLQVLNGKLENFEMLQAMSDYFSDSQLRMVVFDTLQNHIDFKNGVLNIPNMSISSNLGYLELSGKQDMDFNMDYYLRIPWKLVSEAASNKLFGKSRKDAEINDASEVEESSNQRKRRFVNVRIKGNLEDYKVSLEKDEKLKRKNR
jgi:hypothetical protein